VISRCGGAGFFPQRPPRSPRITDELLFFVSGHFLSFIPHICLSRFRNWFPFLIVSPLYRGVRPVEIAVLLFAVFDFLFDQ